MSNSWPAGVPETLWNYSVLQEKVAPQIPMMGIEIAPQFLYMFALGCGFIAYFAWDRFKKRRTETDAFSLRVMKEVGVAELGGTGALRRAYLLYMITLMAIYVAMTFFGKLILQTLNGLNVAGIQVDSSSLKFDSPQWPLLLAFGLAGLAPLIMPLRVAEDWLFGRAYRAVGIPVRIQQTTRNLIDILDRYADRLAKRPADATPASGHASADAPGASRSSSASAPDAPPAKAPRAATPLEAELARKRSDLDRRLRGTWAKAMLAAWGKEEEAFAVFSELLLLVDWAKGGRGSWPGPEVSDEVRKLEQKLVKEAEDLINGFFDQLEPSEKKASEKTLAGRKQRLADVLRDGLALRTEFLAVLAVYAERDPTYVGKSEPEKAENGITSLRITIRPPLRELLGQAEPPNLAGSGPEGGLLLCMVPVFLLYAIFTWQGLHPAISANADPSNWRTVVATAGVETLRVMAIVWLPLVAAFAVRQMFHDRGVWALTPTGDGSAWTEQRVIALSVAAAVSIVALIGLAMLWSFLIAQSVSRFQSLLFSGNPYILFLPTQAIITLPIVCGAMWGADARTSGPSGSWISAPWIGMISGAVVIAAIASHLGFWYGEHRTCSKLGTFLLDLFSPGCFKYYGGLDLFVYPALAFLAAAVFGNPSRVTPAKRRELRRGAAVAVPASIVLLAAMALASPGAKAQAQTPPQTPPQAPAQPPQPIRVGFRADAEPFSYHIDLNRMQPPDARHLHQYVGYIADLCYYIFDQSDYEITEVEVTAENRFNRLKADRSDGGHIDVLCDPVTLRFSEPDRTDAGLFSPIVFASSVTYLDNRKRDRKNSVFVTYVSNTTANLVVEHACQIDLFGAITYDKRDHLAMMCKTADALRLIEDIRIGLEVGDDRRFKPEQPNVRADKLKEAVDALYDAMKLEHQFAQDKNKSSPADKKETTEALLAFWETQKAEAEKLKGKCDPSCGWEAVGDALLRQEDAIGPTCRDLEETPARPATQPPEPLPDQKAQAAKQQALLRDEISYRFCPQKGHDKAIDWLCTPRFGDNAKKSLVYLGDRDVILGKLRSWNDGHGSKCVVSNENGAEDLTYEPYAIMVSEKADNAIALVKHVQRRVYEFFSFRARAVGVFDTYFPKTTGISPLLAYLFLLNATEEERNFLNPTPVIEPPESPPAVVPDAAIISQAAPAETGVARLPRPRAADASPASGLQP